MARRKNAAAVALGKRSGVSLTKKQRIERARKAVSTRWSKAKLPGGVPPGKWYGLVLIPEDPNPPRPGDEDFVGGVAAGMKLLDQSRANPQMLMWSRHRAEVVQRSQQDDLKDRWTEIIDLDYDPARFTIRREYKPDVGAQLKGLRAVLDTEGGKS